MRLAFGQDQHPVFGPVNYQIHELGNSPDGQVASTIGIMRERVLEDSQDPGFAARAALLFPGDMTEEEKVQAVYGHVANAIRFQRDEATGLGMGSTPPDLIEVIIRPVDMAQYIDQGRAIGDCDDFSMYCACLLNVLGVPCSFVTVAADGRAPDQYSHVYVAAYPRDEYGQRRRIAMDTSHGDYPGWEVPNQYGKLSEWSVESFLPCWIGKIALWAGLGTAIYLGGLYALGGTR